MVTFPVVALPGSPPFGQGIHAPGSGLPIVVPGFHGPVVGATGAVCSTVKLTSCAERLTVTLVGESPTRGANSSILPAGVSSATAQIMNVKLYCAPAPWDQTAVRSSEPPQIAPAVNVRFPISADPPTPHPADVPAEFRAEGGLVPAATILSREADAPAVDAASALIANTRMMSRNAARFAVRRPRWRLIGQGRPVHRLKHRSLADVNAYWYSTTSAHGGCVSQRTHASSARAQRGDRIAGGERGWGSPRQTLAGLDGERRTHLDI